MKSAIAPMRTKVNHEKAVWHGKPLYNRKRRLAAALFAGLFLFCGCGKGAGDLLLFEQELAAENEMEQQAENGAEGNEDAAAAQAVSGDAMEPPKPETVPEPAVCIVHICGAVHNPGVYELPDGSRVMDAVTAAGGFLEDADQSACNLAQAIVDGCQIYIMTREESSVLLEEEKSAGIQPQKSLEGVQTADAGERAEAGKVNLNTADAAALKTLPGIGDSRAAAILAFRQENGAFSCIEDIMKVSGIKQAAFDKIKDRITV